MRNPKSAPLSHRNIEKTLLGSQTAPILEEDGAGVFALGQWKFEITVDLDGMTSNESSVVTIWDKANLLAVPLIGGNQLVVQGNLANGVLRVVPEGDEEVLEL